MVVLNFMRNAPWFVVTFTGICLLLFHSDAHAQRQCHKLLKGKASPHAESYISKDLAKPLSKERPPSTLGHARFSMRGMSWNLKNVFTSDDGPSRVNGVKLASGKNGRSENEKPDREMVSLQMTLIEYNPDWLVGQEIENVKAAREVVEGDQELRGLYHVFLIDGNDQRGIDIGFFVKKSLPFKYKLESHRHLQWTDRYKEDGQWKEETIPLFSRDFPVLLFFNKEDANFEKPVLILGGVHAKSKRNRSGDPESQRWRTAQFEGIAQIIQTYHQRYGEDVPVIIAGDYNTEVQSSTEIEPLRQLEIDSAFDKAEEDRLEPYDRGTHAYFSKGGRADFKQIDDIRVRNVRVIRTEIADYRNHKGKEIKWPRTYEEREKQGSDHKAVVADIELTVPGIKSKK